MWPRVLERILETLTLTMSSGDMIIPSVQIGLLASITAILQYLRLEAHKSKYGRALLTSFTENLVTVTIFLFTVYVYH